MHTDAFSLPEFKLNFFSSLQYRRREIDSFRYARGRLRTWCFMHWAWQVRGKLKGEKASMFLSLSDRSYMDWMFAPGPDYMRRGRDVWKVRGKFKKRHTGNPGLFMYGSLPPNPHYHPNPLAASSQAGSHVVPLRHSSCGQRL